MKLGGLQKMTLLDFPGRVACTVFTVGCNFRCPFCHNRSLVVSPAVPEFSQDDFFAFLRKRKGLLDGVAVTGGEPLLHPDMPAFLEKIRSLGFAVKLDTNGAFPDRLRAILEAGLADYVAMDVKNSPEKYEQTAGAAGLLPQLEPPSGAGSQARSAISSRATWTPATSSAAANASTPPPPRRRKRVWRLSDPSSLVPSSGAWKRKVPFISHQTNYNDFTDIEKRRDRYVSGRKAQRQGR